MQFARASSVPAGRKSRGIRRGVRGFKLVMVSASTTSIASSVKKRKKERRLEIRSNPEEQQRTRDIPGDFLYLRDPRQILPICFSEPCPKIHDTTTSTSVRKAQCKDAKWPCKELSRRQATAKRFPERECFVRPRQGDQIPILIS